MTDAAVARMPVVAFLKNEAGPRIDRSARNLSVNYLAWRLHLQPWTEEVTNLVTSWGHTKLKCHSGGTMTHQKQAFVSSLARTRALGALSVTTLALAACGGGSGSSASAPAGPTTPSPVAQVPTPQVPEPTLEPVITPTPVVLPTPGAGPVQAPPPSQQVPTGVNLSNPGVLVKPVAATALSESGANTAMAAIDGSSTTRWESSASNNNWIQFDFGAKTAIGYLKIVWENAYGKEYALQTSDDGQTWYQVRYVVGGKGGVEEFFNLNANVRYVRLQGVARATQYGYSIFEVTFKSPGSDNSLPILATSATPFPANGNGRQPLPAPANPIETI
eukprot:gene20199-39875_t